MTLKATTTRSAQAPATAVAPIDETLRVSSEASGRLLGGVIDTLTLADSGGREALLDAIATQTPVVISDLAAGWPALQRWSPEWLSANYGDKPVRVYDASFGEPGKNYMGDVGTMSFAEYLDETLTQGKDLRMFLYNIGQRIPELLDDVPFPDVGLKFSRNFVFTFFGCKDAVTPLHFDIDMGYVFYTAVHGRRRIRLFAPDQSVALYHHPFTVRSYADLERPDLQAQPLLSQAQGCEVVLEPGQTLCLPPGYWHEFCYLDAGFGISLRASSGNLSDKLRGVANLLALSPIDRLGNKIGGKRWFDWKKQRATERARARLAGLPDQTS